MKSIIGHISRSLAVYPIIGVLAVPVLWVVDIKPAEAVPAFARKYDVTCNACHTRQPRLNPYGQRFLENGYQLPGTADGGRKEKHLLGGELNGVTLDDVSNYLAFRLRADIQQASFADLDATESHDDPEIIFPNVVNMFIAGTLMENLTFFGEVEYATQEGHDAALIFERVFMVFDNVGGPGVANVKIGVFDPSALYSFPTHRQQINPIPPQAHTDGFPPEINRIPLLPLAFSSKMFGLTRGPGLGEVGDTTGAFNPGGSGAVPTYLGEGEDGLSILPFEPMFYNAPFQTGISVHGRPFGNSFLYQVGIVEAKTAEDLPKTTFDPYIMLRYDIQSKFSNFQVSGFYYTAEKAARAALAPPPLAGDIIFSVNTLDWTRMGVAVRWQSKSWDIYGTYITDEIDQPDFGNVGVNTAVWETDANGLSIEADYLLTDKWLLGVRYDVMETGGLSFLPMAFRAPGDVELNQDVSFLALIGKYYPSPNIGLYARYHHNLESSVKLPTNAGGGAEHPATNLESMMTVGVDLAF